MSFYLEEEVEVDFSFPYEKIAEEVVDFCLSYAKFPYEAEVNLTLTDNAGIHAMNKEFRNMDKPTDVLSFPLLSYHIPGNFEFLEAEDSNDFNPDTGEAMLGDIIISIEKVKEQAQCYGHSQLREFAFLITHSMLHLFGYDHITPEDAAVMEQKQETILAALNILR